MLDSCQLKEKLPPLTDVAWEEWSRPLLAFLARPQDMAGLIAWARADRMSGDRLRNMLAWLSFNGHVTPLAAQEGQPQRWVRARAK
jgi:hypothetical protein